MAYEWKKLGNVWSYIHNDHTIVVRASMEEPRRYTAVINGIDMFWRYQLPGDAMEQAERRHTLNVIKIRRYRGGKEHTQRE